VRPMIWGMRWPVYHGPSKVVTTGA
jgi:hypothetical protein